MLLSTYAENYCIKLQPSPAQTAALAETSRQFTAAFNLLVALGWREGVSNATQLHFLAYYPVRTALPDLNGNLTNTARATSRRFGGCKRTARKAPNAFRVY
jgi:hypothetical protein